MRTNNLVLVGGGLLLLGLAGCSGEITRPSAGELPEGLTLLDVSHPEWGISAAYRKLDRVIYLETRVGPLKPEIYRKEWPDDPPNEMDARFVNKDNQTIYVQRGGDTYIDPTWEDDVRKSIFAKFDAAERIQDFALAQEAAHQFPLVATAAALKDHAFLMRTYAARPLPSQDPILKAKVTRILSNPPPLEKPIPGADRAYYDKYYSSVYLETDKYSGDTGCLCFGSCCQAKHSATIMWAYTSGWAIAQNSCNHGRCAGDGGMGYDCWVSGGKWFYNTYINGETNSNNTAISGGCGTSYSWDSGGWDHLCNDDAKYEMWQAVDGSEWTSHGDRYSFTSHDSSSWGGYNSGDSYFACTCQNFNGCHGDWNTPSCNMGGW